MINLQYPVSSVQKLEITGDNGQVIGEVLFRVLTKKELFNELGLNDKEVVGNGIKGDRIVYIDSLRVEEEQTQIKMSAIIQRINRHFKPLHYTSIVRIIPVTWEQTHRGQSYHKVCDINGYGHNQIVISVDLGCVWM